MKKKKKLVYVYFYFSIFMVPLHKDKKDKACRHVITVNGAITRVGENVVLAHFSLFLVSFSNALQKCIASGRHFPN